MADEKNIPIRALPIHTLQRARLSLAVLNGWTPKNEQDQQQKQQGIQRIYKRWPQLKP